MYLCCSGLWSTIGMALPQCDALTMPMQSTIQTTKGDKFEVENADETEDDEKDTDNVENKQQ